jgi:hypothetical protein
LECQTHYQEEDTTRYTRSGDITPMSANYYININIPQEAYYIYFSNQWDMKTNIFHAFDLMRECMTYMYRIQEENVAIEGGG